MLLVMTSRTDSYIQFITVLLLFVMILAAAYGVTRWIAKTQKGRTPEGNLEVMETCRLTPNKYVQIVRAGEKYLVIAIGKDEVHMLAELSREELVFRDASEEKSVDFAAVFDKVRKLKEKEKD